MSTPRTPCVLLLLAMAVRWFVAAEPSTPRRISDEPLSWVSQLPCLDKLPRKLAYPAIATLRNGSAVVGYLANSNTFVLKHICDNQVSLAKTLQCSGLDAHRGYVPHFGASLGGVELLQIRNTNKTQRYLLDRFALNDDGRFTELPSFVLDLVPVRQVPSGVQIYQAIPYMSGSGYAFLGDYDEVHGRLSPDPPRYTKTCVVVAPRQSQAVFSVFAQEGKTHVCRSAYVAGTNGALHSVWIETDGGVFYRRCDANGKWTAKALVCQLAGSSRWSRTDVSVIATIGGVWVAVGEGGAGVTCFKMSADQNACQRLLRDWTPCGIQRHPLPPLIERGSFLAMTPDSNGNAYVVWVDLVRSETPTGRESFSYNLVASRVSVGGQSEPILLDSSREAIVTPSTAIDGSGRLHVAYLKGVGNQRYDVFYVQAAL